MSAKRQSKVLCQRAVPYELYKGLTFTTIWLEVNPRKKMLEGGCEKRIVPKKKKDQEFIMNSRSFFLL